MSWWRSKDRDEQEVLFRSKYGSLVDCFGNLKHELVGRSVAKVLHGELTIVDDEASVAQQIECWRTGERYCGSHTLRQWCSPSC